MVKKIICRYQFTVSRELSSMVLFIDNYKLARYPLTYTITDCLEHFCDGAGWKLADYHYHYEYTNSTGGTVTLLRFFGEETFLDIFRKARELYIEE